MYEMYFSIHKPLKEMSYSFDMQHIQFNNSLVLFDTLLNANLTEYLIQDARTNNTNIEHRCLLK